MENFSFKYFKIVKNALYLKKSARTVTHECQKVNSGGYLLFIVQSERAYKVLFTCLANTKYIYCSMRTSGIFRSQCGALLRKYGKFREV